MPRKKGKSSNISCRNVVNLYNCSGFQVGLKNDLTVKHASGEHKEILEDLNASKNETGLLIVRTILKGYPDGITLTDLRLCIKEEIKELHADAKTFVEISGRNVEDFLHFNKQHFELKGRQQQKTVKTRNTISHKKAMRNNETQDLQDKALDDETPAISDLEGGGSSNKTNLDERKDMCWDEISIAGSECAAESYSSATELYSWIEVTRKGKRQSSISSCHPGHIEQEISGKTLVFLHVIQKPNQTETVFIEDSIEYIDSPTKCMLDIVCLWNRPFYQKSHIIIGIKQSENGNIFRGVSEELGEDFWQYLFLDNVFTMKPLFTHYEIHHNSNLYYMIEVSCSSGFGQPCIVKKNFQIGCTTLFEDELWYRKDASNTVCKPTNPLTGCIYQWFLGQTSISPKIDTEPSNLLNCQIIQSERAALTGVSFNFECDKSNSTNNFQSFWKAVNGFEKGSFVLVNCGVPEKIKQKIRQMGVLPWLVVYDFDIFSYSDGLLNILQDVIGNNRNLQIVTWNDAGGTLSETGTLWCFMRGRKEIPESRTDYEDGRVEHVYEWGKEVKTGLQEQCEKLACFSEDYSPITIVVIWPENEETVPHMGKFLDKIADNLSYQPTVVMLMERQPQTVPGINRLKVLRDEFKDNLHIVQISMESLLHGISTNFSNSKQGTTVHDLPKEESAMNSPITKKEACWLNEDFEVLYLTDPYLTVREEEIEEKMNNFFKGGSLPWSIWYRYGQDKVEIERDSFEEMCSTINPHLDLYKTKIIYLFHAPGSGGSTLAKRILWRFHTKVPCVHLKLGTVNRYLDIVQKVIFVHQRTRLPILLLIDGEEETNVKYLSNNLPYTLILYVKRYPYKVQHSLPKDKIYLAGTVSTKEAKLLASRYGERCDTNKKNALERLAKEVKKGNTHLLFEFGITVYHHEFRGIRAYVQGYLQLQNNPTGELYSWQKCVGYLSLVYYYGQTSVPCQMFAALFGKPSNYVMTLKDDFPHPIAQFVVNDTNDKRKDNIRICHYAVAKEILEQILTRFVMGSKEERSDQLSLQARRNLASFCLDFIEYTSKRKRRLMTLSSAIRLILARTFIFRDEKDMGENEEQKRKRPVLSKLMVDIPAGKPLFTERLQVLEKLVSAYPDDPSFQAHLGRFYAFCRADEEDKVEKYFTEAINLCEKLQNGRAEEEIDDGTKSTLSHVYHMYGIVKHRYLSKYTRRSQTDTANTEKTEESFCERIKELVDVAKLSCHYFTKSRQLTPETREVYTYAYTGEIQVRIQVCDYVKRFFKATTENENIFEAFFISKSDDASKDFIRECISEIEILIHECYTDVELSKDDINSLRTLVSWYNELFKKQQLTSEIDQTNDEYERRRIEISALKLKYASGNSLGAIENVRDKKSIGDMVNLYEENISEALRRGCPGKLDKKYLERDCREWVFAIRNEEFSKDYSLEDVLLRVQRWYEMVRSPTATLYLFILQSLIGFDTDKSHGNTECLVNEKETMEEMVKMSRLIIRPKYPREWLGNQIGGIKMLIPGNRHVGLCPEERGEGNGPAISGLKICKGTVKHPNKNCVGGYINYDMEISSVNVFFIPKRVELIGQRFAGRRVEFNLAFSIERGYEAFNVKLLKRHGCSSCSKVLEFTSADTTLQCTCGAEVHKDSMNEVNHEHDKEHNKQLGKTL